MRRSRAAAGGHTCRDAEAPDLMSLVETRSDLRSLSDSFDPRPRTMLD
jgi:hypothetical protein